MGTISPWKRYYSITYINIFIPADTQFPVTTTSIPNVLFYVQDCKFWDTNMYAKWLCDQNKVTSCCFSRANESWTDTSIHGWIHSLSFNKPKLSAFLGHCKYHSFGLSGA